MSFNHADTLWASVALYQGSHEFLSAGAKMALNMMSLYMVTSSRCEHKIVVVASGECESMSLSMKHALSVFNL